MMIFLYAFLRNPGPQEKRVTGNDIAYHQEQLRLPKEVSLHDRFPDPVRLTDQDFLAYWLLANQQSRENKSEMLVERHASSEHTLLNLQAADLLREA